MARVALLLAGLVAGAAPAAVQMPKAYGANCQVCHRADGSGLPGQFPRLAGRVGPIASTPAGRAYLVDLVLTGMGGKIMVDDRPIMGFMPAYARLPDADLAAILTYAAALGGGAAKPFTVAEIAAGRARKPASASKTKAARDVLAAAGKIP